jgi:predicted PurR-regulated permease PerM
LVAVAIIQIVENVLGPRIVGELTGLNPVWMLISLDIGFKLNGVLGLLVAVPIAGFIKGTFDTIRGVNSPPTIEASPEAHTEVSIK